MSLVFFCPTCSSAKQRLKLTGLHHRARGFDENAQPLGGIANALGARRAANRCLRLAHFASQCGGIVDGDWIRDAKVEPSLGDGQARRHGGLDEGISDSNAALFEPREDQLKALVVRGVSFVTCALGSAARLDDDAQRAVATLNEEVRIDGLALVVESFRPERDGHPWLCSLPRGDCPTGVDPTGRAFRGAIEVAQSVHARLVEEAALGFAVALGGDHPGQVGERDGALASLASIDSKATLGAATRDARALSACSLNPSVTLRKRQQRVDRHLRRSAYAFGQGA